MRARPRQCQLAFQVLCMPPTAVLVYMPLATPLVLHPAATQPADVGVKAERLAVWEHSVSSGSGDGQYSGRARDGGGLAMVTGHFGNVIEVGALGEMWEDAMSGLGRQLRSF